MLHHTRVVPDRAHGQMYQIYVRFFRARARRYPYLGIVTFTFDAWSMVGESKGMVTALPRALLCCHLRPSYQVCAMADLGYRWRVATHSLWLRAER